MTRRKDRLLFALALVFIFVSVLLLNAHTPLMMDDYDYSFSWATGKRLDGVSDILASQAAHYRLWGGRSMVHFLAQLFLYLGKPAFNIANALMYVLLLLEILYLAGRRRQACNGRMLLIAHTALMLTVPFFGTVFLWLDGACNYLWGTALAILPLVILKSEREGGFFDAGYSHGILALPVCLIAGWTNENAACGVLAAAFLMMLWDRRNGRPVRSWRLAAWAAQALGVALMLLAPGNFARAAGESSRGVIAELLYRFAVTSYCMLRYAGVHAALLGMLLLLVRKRKASVCTERIVILLGTALLSAYALVGSPQISDRSFTVVLVLMMAAWLSALTDLTADWEGRMSPYRLPVGCMAAALLVWISFGAWRDVTAHEAAWLTQTRAMEAAAAAGESDVFVSSVPGTSRFTMEITLASDPSAWPNSTLGKYYGVRVHAAEEIRAAEE